jgi:transcriptional regulator with XRE-family HTH domain
MSTTFKSSKSPTSTSFKTYVEDVERNNTPEEQRALEDSRRRFAIGSRLLDRRLDQAEISRIERGQANPTVQTLQALGAPLGVVLDFAAS